MVQRPQLYFRQPHACINERNRECKPCGQDDSEEVVEELRNVAKERNLNGKDIPQIDDKDLSLETANQAKRTATGARSALAYFLSKF